MAYTLDGKGPILVALRRWLRKLMDFQVNRHLSRFTISPFCYRMEKTASRCSL
jgi:hypothetical protein